MGVDRKARDSWPPVILILVISASLIELTLQGADHGLWATRRLRSLTYQHTAFWPGLLAGWKPNYPAQPYVMFVSYAFVHAGFVHLLVNMITLVSLGRAVVRDVGQVGFLVIYAISALIGALVFAITATSFQPMVGASGALFGLAGALVFWNIRYAFAQDQSITMKIASIIWPIGILTLLNLAMYYGFDKNVAWQTHLGGFIGGAIAAAFMRESEIADPLP